MSVVNPPFVGGITTHYAEADHTSALCGAVVVVGATSTGQFSNATNATMDLSRLTCADCAIRSLALLQDQQNKLIQQIAKLVLKK